ncbi:TaqI-like C-terminal specificity domain-containing protein [Stenoxybacter acetivorans]|uniref:TaqI-like C-terminal specificity domain-containing protein n=1 Tax=Stenoxybacter acetivorans TaxID=422441 RepID=UPI00055C0421|nr:TaqI-like C-terminal specificity domain-containing protein [Stenoxybacter acetivorans]
MAIFAATKKLTSTATDYNWVKLGVTDTSNKLQSYANKSLSVRRIIPKESFDNLENYLFIERLVDFICAEKIPIADAVYSIGLNLLKEHHVSPKNIHQIKAEYSFEKIDCLYNKKYPNEFDLLGIVYQSLITEGEKNKSGSYYTPKTLVKEILQGIEFDSQTQFLDPACGSLNFLLSIDGIQPEQIHGVDIDAIAVMIAKFKYYLKFPDTTVTPKIYQANFLAENNLFDSTDTGCLKNIIKNQFDYIITNPPWGALQSFGHYPKIKSGETFSYFLVKAYDFLRKNGNMVFLLPKSILNIRIHADIRKFLIEQTNLKKINVHTGSFSGVMTAYVSLLASKQTIAPVFEIAGSVHSKTAVNAQTDYLISMVSEQDSDILKKIENKGEHTLADSVWALGVVTGNNKEKLLNQPLFGSEPIYTGKEIQPYVLKKPIKFIVYDRSQFQQVAKEEIYRAPEKLAYKFISKKLQFAYDNTQSLFLNSANILIPNVPTLSIKSVMAFLNSELFQYWYLKKFDDIKILKGNLLQLYFPVLSQEQDHVLSVLTELSDRINKVNEFIYHFYQISGTEQEYIKEVLWES